MPKVLEYLLVTKLNAITSRGSTGSFGFFSHPKNYRLQIKPTLPYSTFEQIKSNNSGRVFIRPKSLIFGASENITIFPKIGVFGGEVVQKS